MGSQKGSKMGSCCNAENGVFGAGFRMLPDENPCILWKPKKNQKKPKKTEKKSKKVRKSLDSDRKKMKKSIFSDFFFRFRPERSTDFKLFQKRVFSEKTVFFRSKISFFSLFFRIAPNCPITKNEKKC
jgi:hypothetical protein